MLISERGGGAGCAPTSFLVFSFTLVVIPDPHLATLRSSSALSVGEGTLSPWTWLVVAVSPCSALQRVKEWRPREGQGHTLSLWWAADCKAALVVGVCVCVC